MAGDSAGDYWGYIYPWKKRGERGKGEKTKKQAKKICLRDGK